MNANKKPLARAGQLGLIMLVGGMVVSVAAGSLMGLIGLLCGVGGFYVLTHQESIKLPFSKEGA